MSIFYIIISNMTSTNNCEQLSLINPDSIPEVEENIFDILPYDVIDTMNNDLSEIIREQEDTYDQEFTKIMLEQFPHLKNSNNSSSSDSDTKTMLAFRPPTSPKNNSKTSFDFFKYSISDLDVGDGNFDYVNNTQERFMFENAWQAITQTNSWGFVSQEIDTYTFSKDPHIDIISKKMEELGYTNHSGTSFGCTMRNMQYLVTYGEKKFKKLFDGTHDTEEDDPDRDTELNPAPHEDAMEYEERLKLLTKKRVEKEKREKELMDYMGGY